MIDTNRLRGIIAERNLSQRQVAALLGMADRTFYTKMKNGVFGTDEAQKMVDLLEINHPEEIFFAKEVTCKDTSKQERR